MFIEYIPFVIENTNVDFIIKKCVFIRIPIFLIITSTVRCRLKSNRLIIEDKSLGDIPQSNFRADTNFIKLQSWSLTAANGMEPHIW